MWKELWCYESNVSKLAALKTLRLIGGSTKRILVESILYVLGTSIYLYYGGLQAMQQELLVGISYVLLPAVTIFLILFIFCRTVTPITLMQNLEEHKRRTEQELSEIKQTIRARVDVIFLPGERPYEETNPLICNVLASRRTFALGIRNRGSEILLHVSVKLQNISPPGAFVPINLKLRSERPSPSQYLNYDFRQEFALRSGEIEYVDVAFLYETNKSSEIELCYATEGHRNGHIARTIKRSDHILFIDVFADIGEPIYTQFKLYVDNGFLRLQRIA